VSGEVRDEVAQHRGAALVARSFTQPQGVSQRTEAFVAATRAQAREAVVHPERGVGLDREALFAKDQHGATLVAALGLATSALDGGHCRFARFFDDVSHDAQRFCERRANTGSCVRRDPGSSRRETKVNHFATASGSYQVVFGRKYPGRSRPGG
jgi:hypothetical protein